MTTPAHNHDVRGPLAPPHRDALDLAMADAPVDGLLRQHAPVFALGGPGPRIVWASRAALTLFGVAGLAALTTAVLGSDSPGGQRLVELAVAPRRDDKPQLERLRFFFNATSGPLTCLTRRFVAPGGGPLLVVGVLGTRSCEKGDALQTLLTDEAAFVTAAHVEEIVQSAPRLDFAQAQADLAGRYGARTTLRFVWQTDALNAVVHIGPELAQLLGRAPVSPGDDLMQVLARDGIDPAGEVRAALAGQQTWSGLDSSWPLFGGFAQVPVRLAATPLLDADSRFAGYRGFGLVQIDRLSPRASLEPVAELPGTALERILPITLRQAKAVAMADLPQDVAAGTAYAGPHDGQGDQPAPQPPPHSGHDQDTADAELNFFDANEAVHLRSATHDHALKMQNEISEAFLQPEAGSYGTAPPLAVAAAPVLVLPPRSGTVLLRKSATLIPASQAGMNLPENYLPGHNLPESNLAGAALAGMDIVTVHPASPPAVLRPAWVTVSPDETVTLSPVERQAFRDIARALGARVPDDEPDEELLAAGTDAPKPQLHALDPEAEDSEPPLALPVANAGVQATLAEVAADFSTAEPAGDSDHRQDNDIHGRHVFAAGQASAPPEAAYAVPDGDDGAASLHRNAELLLDRLPVGVIVCRGEVPIYVNATQLDLLGYDSADDFYAHGGLARMFRGRQPEALDPGTNGGAVPIVTADGEVLSVDARLQTISWDDLPATLITFRRAAEPDDVPRLRAMEMDVRARETELRELHAILDTATDGVAVIDDGGRILSLNRSAQAVFGYDQNEVAGDAFTLLFDSQSHTQVEDYFAKLKGDGPASVMNDGREVTGRERQGGTMPLYLTLGRIGLGDKGKFCAVLRDLTQFRRTERELGEARKQAEKASALKSDFLAKVSHEIRTPLNSILGFTEVIMDERLGPIGNDRYKDYLKDIHSSGTHVLSLVNDLLDLSKIEAGKADMNFVAVDANRIIAECVSLMQPQAAKVRVIMRLSLAMQLPHVVADERSLRQIALNLLSNAIKFTEPGGQVIVSTTLTESGSAVIRVKDTGIGMSEDEIGAALEPFRQIATTRKTTGTGLGLPLTKALIEANRASFSIKSRRDEGTLVEVIFPSTRVLAE